MGVDGFIFDAESKQCLDFDRLSNLQRGVWGSPEKIQDIYGKLTSFTPPAGAVTVSSAEVVELMNATIAAWDREPEDQRYHGNWCRSVKEFAQMRPTGRFFVLTDHSYPDCNDQLKKYGRGEYVEVEIVEIETPVAVPKAAL